MKKIGFTTSTMPEEGRVAIVPEDISKIINPHKLYFQKDYAKHLGIEDGEYKKHGSNIISLEDISELEIICIPKRWKDDEKIFREGQTLWGWLYVSQTPWLASALTEKKMTAIAFEKMYNEDGICPFRENRDITGFIGMMQALPYAGKPPELLNVAVLGRGNVAKGALKILDKFGVKYKIFHTQNVQDFYTAMGEYDMIVNCVRLNNPVSDMVITKEDISSMKKGCLIVDLTSDGIEGSLPHPIRSPVYNYNQILIYNNEHIPTLWAKYSSEKISHNIIPFVNDLITETTNKIIEKAIVISKGHILDKNIYPAFDNSINFVNTD